MWQQVHKRFLKSSLIHRPIIITVSCPAASTACLLSAENHLWPNQFHFECDRVFLLIQVISTVNSLPWCTLNYKTRLRLERERCLARYFIWPQFALTQAPKGCCFCCCYCCWSKSPVSRLLPDSIGEKGTCCACLLLLGVDRSLPPQLSSIASSAQT